MFPEANISRPLSKITGQRNTCHPLQVNGGKVDPGQDEAPPVARRAL